MFITHFETIVSEIGGAVIGAGVMLATLRRNFKRMSNFLDDWNGEPERPGVNSRPGVMERMQQMDNRLHVVEGQMTPNGGSSMKDQLNRIDKHITDNPKDSPKDQKEN